MTVAKGVINRRDPEAKLEGREANTNPSQVFLNLK